MGRLEAWPTSEGAHLVWIEGGAVELLCVLWLS